MTHQEAEAKAHALEAERLLNSPVPPHMNPLVSLTKANVHVTLALVCLGLADDDS